MQGLKSSESMTRYDRAEHSLKPTHKKYHTHTHTHTHPQTLSLKYFDGLGKSNVGLHNKLRKKRVF